jgi:hypothetical protein
VFVESWGLNIRRKGFGVSLCFLLGFGGLGFAYGNTENHCRLSTLQLALADHEHRVTPEWVEEQIQDNPSVKLCISKIPPCFLVEKDRLLRLAWDPDQGKISADSLREAMAGIEAVRRGYLTGPLRRAPRGYQSEFYTGDGAPIDVKAPVSPKDKDRWIFDVPRIRNSIASKLRSETTHLRTGELVRIRVILDTSYLTSSHFYEVWEELNLQLSLDELHRIQILSLPGPPTPGIRTDFGWQD